MAKKDLPKKVRAALMEELKNVDSITSERDDKEPIHTPDVYKEPERVKIVGLPHIKHRLELAKLLDKLRDIIDSKVEAPLKYSELIRAIELAAKLEGHIHTQKEEKHLHLHGSDLSAFSESQLRDELAKLENKQSSSYASGVPHAIDATYKSSVNG